MSITRKRSATLTLTLLACLLSIASGQAAAATSPRLVVSAPTTAPSIPGKVAVSASLNSSRSEKVRVARFYVNNILVTTDRRYPFKVKRGVTFDTRQLPAAKPYLRLAVKYDQRRKSGKIAKMTLKKSIRVAFLITPDPNVNAQSTGPPPVPTKFGYPLAFSDEFDGTALNTGKWNRQRYDRLDLWTTDPLSHPFNDKEDAAYGIPNVSVVDGALNLKLLDSKATGSAPEYTRSTGMVNSRNKFSFKYGYVETRALVPDCIGCWPTFWVMPGDDTWPPEIDIFEFINVQSAQARYPFSVFHWKPDGSEGDNQHEHHVNEPDEQPQEWFVTKPAGNTGNFMGQWHTYGMLWTPAFVEIYFDGVLGARVEGVTKLPQQPMYAIFQMAIGKAEYGIPPAGSTMKIDYVHVFTSNP